jgi:PleD family two-component response regulator
VSVSGGLAGGEVPSSIGEVERWFEQADQALYEAKQAGRDRVYPIPNSTPLLQDLLEN